MSLPRPHSPFADWALQIIDDSWGYAWFTEPATLVTHTFVTQGTRAHVTAVQDVVDDMLTRHAKAISEAGGMLSIHDMRTLKGYDRDARIAWFDRMRKRPKGYLRASAIIVPATPLVRMAVQAGNLLMALYTGGKLEMETDPAPVLERHRVVRPT